LSFVFFYVATLILLIWTGLPFIQWTGFLAVSVATVAAVAIWSPGDRSVGLIVAPHLALLELLRGLLWGFVLITSCVALVMACTSIRLQAGVGFPWRDLWLVFIPAVVHEELLFRGFAFQRLLRWNRLFALLFGAVIFAALHAGNDSVTPLGLLNVFLGGLLLGLAFERFGRLWFPIGIHLAWNLTTGPIFGDEVSGFGMPRSMLIETGGGPDALTGGTFGIEGSVLMTLVELAAIALLARRISSARSALGSEPDPPAL
jgi:membrane protease YdiL (CAAX protease family)